jgi:UDP-GlcNAc3NAcA epimerase
MTKIWAKFFCGDMEIPKPNINLHIGSGNHGKTIGRMLESIEQAILDKKTDVLLVYGDTYSIFAGALAASKLHVPVIHVEAGLRSYMLAMPEEQNLRVTDHLVTWFFCPTLAARDNLLWEGIADCGVAVKPGIDNKRVAITGDIMYDVAL